MSSNFKYTLHKHKSKIVIGSSILLFGGIGTGVYFLMSDNDLFGEVEAPEQESNLAEYIVSGSNEGTISLMDVETGESINSVSLPSGTYLFTPSNGYDMAYAYDGKTISGYTFKRDKIREAGEITQIQVSEATDFKVEGENVAILSNNGQTLTYQYRDEGNVKEKTIELQDNVTDFHIQDGVLYYSSNTNLYAFSPSSEEVIDLGDVSDVITTFQDRVLIHNQFGSGLENSILMSLQKEDMKILELQETKSAKTQLLPMDSDDNTFYTTQYVQSSEPYHLLDTWRIEDGKIVKNKDVTVKVPVKEDGIVYDDETTVASDGFLYTHFKDRTQIFDIRSQSLLKNVSVDEDFSMPVLNK